MIARSLTPPDRLSSAGALAPLQSVAQMLGISLTSCIGVQLEAPGTNTGDILYGTEAAQPMSLGTGEKTDILPVKSLGDLYLVGNGSDTVSVLVFQ